MPTLHPPKYKPAKVAAAAMKQYDLDSNGTIDRKELDVSPTLSAAMDRIDGDENGQLTEEEIATFVQEKWLGEKAGGIRVKCVVKMDGRDLPNAKVVFEPDAFIGDLVGSATGKTMGDGFTTLSDPTIEQGGVRPGLYLVRITTEDGKVPAKYNTETTLGVEVAKKASYMPGEVVFELKSR